MTEQEDRTTTSVGIDHAGEPDWNLLAAMLGSFVGKTVRVVTRGFDEYEGLVLTVEPVTDDTAAKLVVSELNTAPGIHVVIPLDSIARLETL